MSDRVLHCCWEDGPLTDDGCTTTCFLLYGHDGPHEWTRDDQVSVHIVLISGDAEPREPEAPTPEVPVTQPNPTKE